MTVGTTLHVNENTNLITCTVMDTDGRQNRAQKHIFIQCVFHIIEYFDMTFQKIGKCGGCSILDT